MAALQLQNNFETLTRQEAESIFTFGRLLWLGTFSDLTAGEKGTAGLAFLCSKVGI